ncbi:MAG: dienelactone hydrolase [Pseudomonadota bacterium]
MGRVGYRIGKLEDEGRRDWADSAPRPLRWSAWYPCAPGSEAAEVAGLFATGPVARDAALIESDRPFPVVLMSHGTGGSPESLGWLACALARAGHVVIGAHHHGNTGSEPYRGEGFLCWWERAADLSALLDALDAAGPFAGRLDTERTRALGFSLGCHSVLSLLGARSDMARFDAWLERNPEFGDGPREFPNLGTQVGALMDRSPAFRASWARQGESFFDLRIVASVAIAAAPPVRAFTPESLAGIARPVTLLTGEADQEAPTSEGAVWLCEMNPGFRHVSLGADAGHYSFLGKPAGPVPDEAGFIFDDPPTLDRGALHARTAELVLDAFAL